MREFIVLKTYLFYRFCLSKDCLDTVLEDEVDSLEHMKQLLIAEARARRKAITRIQAGIRWPLSTDLAQHSSDSGKNEDI